MKAALIGVLFLAVTSPAFAGNDCATKAGYERLTSGMSYRQAVAALGCEGEELSSTDLGGTKTVMYMWVGSGFAGVMGGNMNAMFQGDRMVNKAQMGLK